VGTTSLEREEAVELAVRSAMCQACAAALTELLQFEALVKAKDNAEPELMQEFLQTF
jgi:hypothetical protein